MFEDDGPLATMGGVSWIKENTDVLVEAIHPYDPKLDKLSRFALYRTTESDCDFEWKDWNIKLTRELVLINCRDDHSYIDYAPVKNTTESYDWLKWHQSNDTTPDTNAVLLIMGRDGCVCFIPIIVHLLVYG